MQDVVIAKESCPNCHQILEIHAFRNWNEENKIISAPPDIKCSCGTVLRVVVPVFKVSESGYLLRPLFLREVPRYATNP